MKLLQPMNAFGIRFFSLFALTIFIITDAARILAYFPVPSISHQAVYKPLTQELLKRGHEVTVITTDTAFTKETRPKNLTEIDLHNDSYNLWRHHTRFEALSNKKKGMFAQIYAITKCLHEIIDLQFKTKELKEILKKDSKYYDLIIIEFQRQSLILSHIFEAPVIQLNSFGAIYETYNTMGAVAHPLYNPTIMRHKLNDLTIWDKLTELYNHFHGEYIYIAFSNEINKWFKKYTMPKAPSVQELQNNIDVMCLNANPNWGENVAVPLTVLHVGGLHQKPEKEISEDLKLYLDSSTNGVIYISFGTNINPDLLPPEKIQMFVNVLSKLPYNVLWKWNSEEHPTKAFNIRFGKWFPQSDLLRHRNVKLFITQGGLQSTDEAIAAGVPLVGVPMLSDQWYNVEKYIQHKIGVGLDIDILTENHIRDAITTVLKNERYYRNVRRLGTLMRDEPQTSLERSVWWTEYVIRHRGAKHLRSPAANISWAEYLELELFITALGVFALVVAIIFKIVQCIWFRVKRGLKIRKKNKPT